MKTFFVCFVGCLLLSHAFGYTNPLQKYAEERSDLKNDLVKDYTSPVNNNYPVGDYSVFSSDLLEKGDSCYLPSLMPSDAATYTRLGCKKDLVCMPTDLEACATSAFGQEDSFDVTVQKCRGTCVDFQPEGGACHADANSAVLSIESCAEGLYCNMNTDGMKSAGVCTKLFSLEEDAIASSSVLCKYGLIVSVAESTAVHVYERRSLYKCASPSVMECNSTFSVAKIGCECGSTDQTGYQQFICPVNSVAYSCRKDDAGSRTCQFLHPECQSEYETFYSAALRFQSGIAKQSGMTNPRSKAHREHLKAIQKDFYQCFDKANYQNGNPADSIQSSAATLTLSFVAVLLSVVLMLL